MGIESWMIWRVIIIQQEKDFMKSERRIKQLRRLHLQINYVLLVPAQITINWILTTIKTICLLSQHVSTIFYSYHDTKAKPNQRLQFFSQSSSSAAKMLPFVLVLLNWFPWQTLVSAGELWDRWIRSFVASKFLLSTIFLYKIAIGYGKITNTTSRQWNLTMNRF